MKGKELVECGVIFILVIEPCSTYVIKFLLVW
jgi:hypothetical protein